MGIGHGLGFAIYSHQPSAGGPIPTFRILLENGTDALLTEFGDTIILE